MTSPKSPKVVLFDIGGVCVLSPFQGIIDFERKHGITTDWINFAIRHGSPNGHWQRLERGEIKLDADFFKGFTSDLHNDDAWRYFHHNFRNEKKTLKDTANPTQLGDHVSLKAEAADSEPTEQDRGSRNSSMSSSSSSTSSSSDTRSQEQPKPSLSKLAKDTTIGDPISIESEEVAESTQAIKDSHGSGPIVQQHKVTGNSSSQSGDFPLMMRIDGETLFWSMMASSRELDPYVFPALERLSKQNPRPILSALSNTVVYPPDHPWSKQKDPTSTASASNAFLSNPASLFDVYVASAEVGMRKPSADIYRLTIQRLDEFDKQKGGNGVTAEDIIFLDDIGENLKTAQELGMKTIKVQLGKTWRAVKELEGVLKIDLMDDKTRRSKL